MAALNGANIAGEAGSAIGNFLGPVFGSLGSNTTTEVTEAPKTDNTKTIAVVVVFVIIIVASYFLFFKKPTAAPKLPAPAAA